MNFRKPAFVAAFAVFALSAGTAAAAETQGRISEYHLNTRVADRGACVRLFSGWSGTPSPTGWYCHYDSDLLLFENVKELLLHAWLHRRSCRFSWQTGPEGHAWIDWVSCFQSR